jgi:ElaB/YqjD/DUF883 family membrane-anchored ribosome-binding protein
MMLERWGQMRSDIQRRWHRLSDSDLDASQSGANKLAEAVADRYGQGRAQAEKQVRDFVRRYGDRPRETGGQMAGRMRSFVNENPWTVIAIVALIIGILGRVLTRPDARRYY